MTIADFELLIERNQNSMYRVAIQILKDAHTAEDAVQDAFVRMFRIVSTLEFENDRAEKVYVLRAVKSTAIDALRRQKNIDHLDDIDPLSLSGGDFTYNTISETETIRQVHTLLGPRATTILCYRNMGLSDREISETLNISISNVRSIVYRAKQRVSQCLGKETLQEI